MSRAQRLQKVAFWVAVVGGSLGFLASVGCRALPVVPQGWVAWLHPLLLGLGAVSGWFASRRGEEIDGERWRIVEDSQLTSGEREYAHKYAEGQRRRAGTAFVAAPVLLGYWMAYQVEGEGEWLAAQLLPGSGLIGSIAGMLAARLFGAGDGKN